MSGHEAGVAARLHLETTDPGRSVLPPAVLVHGVLDSARSFGRLRRLLGERRRTVAYDRRGYQRSRDKGAAAGRLEDHVEDLVEVLEHAVIASPDAKAVVLGHSYGGVVALAAAEARPDLLAAVVVYEPPLPSLVLPGASAARPGAPPARRGPSPAARRAATFGPVVPVEGEPPGAFAARFAAGALGADRYDRLAAEVRDGLALDGPAASLEVAELSLAVPFDPSLVAPHVVVARGSLAAERFVVASTWLLAHLPDATAAVVEGAGHGAHLSHPRALAAILDDAASGRRTDTGAGTGTGSRP